VRHFPYGRLSRELADHIASRTAGAVIVEPVVGREGVLVPPSSWLMELAELCRRSGTLLILDEIFTGLGRTGHLFAADGESVVPDLLCCGKALGGGLPIAAVIGSRTVFRAWETSGEALHTATFVANPLACAAALAVLTVIERDGLVDRSNRLGQDLLARLESWPGRYPELIEEVRGRGLLAGVAFRQAAAAKKFADDALHSGIILLNGGPEGRVAQIVPPLSIDEDLLNNTLSILEGVLAGSLVRPATA
jgi:acetylornithine/succinyldiaminopimelate/putrescine aminotransferase